MTEIYGTPDGGVMEIGDWHQWFAWCPVWTTDRGTIWLRLVERRFSRKTWPHGQLTHVVNYRPAIRHALSQAPSGEDGSRG